MYAGLYGAIWPGKTARTTKNSSKIAPAVPLRERKRARANLPLALWVSLRLIMGSALTCLSGPGIDDHRDHVGREHAEHDGNGNEQEYGLHERVIQPLYRGQQQGPEARVVEDVLDDDGAGDDEAERHRESGEVGEDGVPPDVSPHDPPRLQALGARRADVVLGHDRDHVVPHGEDPAADRGEQDGQARQDGVLEYVHDVGPVPAGRVVEEVVRTLLREDAEPDREHVDKDQPDPEIGEGRRDD